MDLPRTRGQTALEYLLIVVVAVIVVVSVMMWMQKATSTASETANVSKSELICESYTCDEHNPCGQVAACNGLSPSCVNGFCSASSP